METILWIENYLTRTEEIIIEGRVEEGFSVLNDLLYDEPGYGPLHNYLGWAYMYYGNDARKAEMHFTMAMRFAPNYASAYVHMGNLLSRAGRYAEAIEYFRAGLTKPEVNRTAVLEGIAHAHELQGEYRHAIRVFKEAATTSVVDMEVDRMLKAANRCSRKRLALLFSFW